MKRTYLAQCLAVLALGLMAVSCSESDYAEQILTEEQAFENAEKQLGITIDPNQTWLMTQQVTASITFNGDYDTENTAIIYENNPVLDGTGVVLGQATVKSGETAKFTFTAPSGNSLVYAAVVDYLGYTYVKPVAIVDGMVSAEFGDNAVSPANVARRSTTNSHVNIPTCTVTDTYVKSFLTDAKEPTDANVADNSDNSVYHEATERHWVVDKESQIVWPTLPQYYWQGIAAQIKDNWGSPSEDDKAWFEANCRPLASWSLVYSPDDAKLANQDAYIDLFLEVYDKLRATGRTDWMNVSTWPVKSRKTAEEGHWEEATPAYWDYDETYVKKFKITGTWNKLIGVLPTEKDYGDARTVYVSGKWTIPADQEQRVGGGAVVVVDDGGEIIIPAGASLNFVNQARLVVVGTGKITGEGSITVANGTAEGEECYNSGTISVKSINQNYGSFFNYGTIDSETLIGGAGTSCFVNHGLINIREAYGNNGAAANLQIKNNCWFEASNDVACKILENGANAYMKCKNLSMSGGEGGENLGSYMSVDAGSRIYITNDLSGNGTSIVGPTSGNYAYICVGGYVKQWIWKNYTDYPTVRHEGMIINNIKIYARPDSNTAWNWTHMLNETVLDTDTWTNWGNKIGNGHVDQLTVMDGYNTATTEASQCAPAFTPWQDPTPVVQTYPVYSYAFEDTNGGDYDMNDVVIRVQEVVVNDEHKIKLTLVAIGAALNLNIRLYPAPSTRSESELAHYEGTPSLLTINNEQEVHLMLKSEQGVMTNTGDGARAPFQYTLIDKGNYDPAHLPLAIIPVGKDERYEMRLASGRSPFGIIVPGNWKWPVERVAITTAYNSTETSEGNQSFAKFGEEVGSAKLWYNYPSSTSLVMDESSLGF